MLKKILLLVFCLVFANLVFSQVFDQLEEIRANKVVKVHVEDEGRYTISIEHSPNEMYIVLPHFDSEGDTTFHHHYFRDEDVSYTDSIYYAHKYAYVGTDNFKTYFYYDSLSKLIEEKEFWYYDSLSTLTEEEIFYGNKPDNATIYKYNELGQVDSLIYYDVTIQHSFGITVTDSLHLSQIIRYEYDSLGRESKVFGPDTYGKREKEYVYNEQDELIEIRKFNGFSRSGCIVDSSIKNYTSITFEDDENGFLREEIERDFALKDDKEVIEETFYETYYEYLENGLIKSETHKSFRMKNDKKKSRSKYKIRYDYDFFTYDIYKPLDAENTKADTTDKIPVVENELITLLNGFDWSAYPAYPTISVHHNLGESTLWVAKYAESDDDDKLEMFILGHHENIEKRAFFGLGKKRMKERKNIYMAVGLDNVKMLYQLYFAGKTEALKNKLKALNKEIKF